MGTIKPNVAFLSSPGMGHLIPSLELAKRLVTLHDVHVSFLVITTDASVAQSKLLESSMLPRGLRVIHLPPADVKNLVNDDTTIVTRISIVVRESLPAIRSVLADVPRPTVLIADLFCTDAFDIASELIVSNYLFFTTSAHALAFLLHLPVLDEEVDGQYVDLPGPVSVPGCDPICTVDLIDQVRDRTIDEYKWFLHHASRFRMAEGVFVNTTEELEQKSVNALRCDPTLPRVYTVGPLVKSDDVDEAEIECMTWLDAQPQGSVLYVSFGSGGTLSVEQMTELARGFELSRQRFLWVARPPIEAKASGTFFTIGSEGGCKPSDYLPDGFLSRIQGRGFVVSSWAPQAKILAHRSTGGFLTHCGWNSIVESVAHGVPMVAWPLYAEQRMNATMVVESLGVAARATVPPGGVVGREEIERVVRTVMAREGGEGEKIRSKAGELKHESSKATEEGGSSFNSLQAAVDEWRGVENDLKGNQKINLLLKATATRTNPVERCHDNGSPRLREETQLHRRNLRMTARKKMKTMSREPLFVDPAGKTTMTTNSGYAAMCARNGSTADVLGLRPQRPSILSNTSAHLALPRELEFKWKFLIIRKQRQVSCAVKV